MNKHVRVLAYLYIALCGSAIAAGLFICGGLFLETLSGDESARKAFVVIGMPFLILSVVYFVPGLLGGIGLLRGKPWARTVILVLSFLVLFGIPIGTVFGGYGIWVLKQTRTTPPRPAQQPPGESPVDRALAALLEVTPKERSRRTTILLMMAGVGAFFIVVIGTGYRVTNDPSSPIGDPLYYFGIIVFIVTCAIGIRAVMRNPPRLGPYLSVWSIGDGPALRKLEKEQRERLARLTADPVRSKYVWRIERGEYWPDERIDYAENPNQLATCEHLRPIERAMRDSGIVVHLKHEPDVEADCRVDAEALAREFLLPPSVNYAEMHIPDRSLEDPPFAVISCSACRSSIEVVHPQNAQANTPWFPLGSRPTT